MVAKIYLEGIANPALRLPNAGALGQHVWHLFVIRCAARDALQQHLKAAGIQTLIHYPIPAHKQAAYKEYNHLSYPLTEQIQNEILSLPIGPSISLDKVQRVVDACNRFACKQVY
jgi:dTDP-4-amino-4,6-dideoxygalactose transaminase